MKVYTIIIADYEFRSNKNLEDKIFLFTDKDLAHEKAFSIIKENIDQISDEEFDILNNLYNEKKYKDCYKYYNEELSLDNDDFGEIIYYETNLNI